ncbi:hypothetical protein ACFSCX_19755 [Bacillus salitolerans]|uniref:DUF4871 domain-containing protein n=1 Tax=Bacillus salitolerans TaxID=1437434 RepID=A0ABW4LV37_9BACI
MAHIITGLILLLTGLLFIFIDRYFPYVELMSGFTEKGFKRIIGSLITIGVLLVSFGVYTYVTYQPPFIEVRAAGEKYLIDGEIGTVGYILNEMDIYREHKETSIHLVFWDSIDVEKVTISLTSPSGTVIESNGKFHLVQNEMSKAVKEQIQFASVYEWSPVTFSQSGKWKVTVTGDGKHMASWTISVFQEISS